MLNIIVSRQERRDKNLNEINLIMDLVEQITQTTTPQHRITNITNNTDQCERRITMEYQFTEANFETEVLKSDIPVLVDFYADWCGPCKMMMPIVEKMAEKYDGKMKVGKVNSDENGNLAGRYNIMSIPSFLIFKNGEVIDSVAGAMSADALAARLDAAL